MRTIVGNAFMQDLILNMRNVHRSADAYFVDVCFLARFCHDCSLKDVAEIFAEQFCRPISPPPGIEEYLIPLGGSHPCCNPDEEFSLSELRAALKVCRKKSAPGEDGISYKVLCNLDAFYHIVLLQLYNNVWHSGIIPASWRTSVVCPVKKPGKSSNCPSSYRSIPLTSCVGKLIESSGAFPQKMSGFRPHRSLADCIGHLASALEGARDIQHPVYLFF